MNTRETVIETIEAHFDASEIDDDTNLEADLGMDSLDMVDMLIAIESKLRISINDDAFEPMPVTVGDLIKIVERFAE